MVRRVTTVAAVVLTCGSTSAFAEPVIIKCPASCDAVVRAIEQNGGKVKYRYKYVNAVAADLPDPAVGAVRAAAGEGAIRKDMIVTTAIARDPRGNPLVAHVAVESAMMLDVEALQAIDAVPNAYRFTNTLLNVAPLHTAGFLGRGMRVAVLDSGLRPGFLHLVNSNENSIIGGENFVNDGRAFSHPENDGHGTFVAGMISANIAVPVLRKSAFGNALNLYCGLGCIIPFTDTIGIVPMVGSAPQSDIYALRVLGVDGTGPQSGILAAMERVIDLRIAFDKGAAEVRKPDGSFDALNIRVANMSFGGATLFPGRDVEDEMTNAFLDHDILPVVAAGNSGPSGATIASPGSGVSSLTVGAASTAVHERVFVEVLYATLLGPEVGGKFRPFGGTQTAYFSSRGPNADGRPDPDVLVNGMGCFGQGLGPPGSVSLAAGTSVSAPTVAGVAAVLRQAVPTATARQVRNALIAAARPDVLGDGSGPLDQGAGFVDAAAARAMLAAMPAPDTAPEPGPGFGSVAWNIKLGADVQTWYGNVTRSVSGLLPGQRFETFYRVFPYTKAVTVELSGVTPGATQNVLFGDDILMTVHSAKTSAIGSLGDYKVFEFTKGGTWTIQNPDQGIMRITVNGDTSNASPIAATISIQSIYDFEFWRTASPRIADGQVVAVPFSVRAGAEVLSLRADWVGDWGHYPTNDIDVILERPDGTLEFAAATLNSPERAEIKNPPAGKWVAHIVGFTVSTGGDRVKLRLEVDGRVIRDWRGWDD